MIQLIASLLLCAGPATAPVPTQAQTPPAATASVTVALPMEAHIRGTEVLVGAVAEITGADPEVVSAVQRLSLGYAPSPGYSRLIWNHKIAEVIRQHDKGLHVTFQGQRATRVWPVVETIHAEEVARVAEEAIAAAVGAGDFSWQLRDKLRDIDVPASAQAAQLVAKPIRGAIEGGVLAVPVEVRIGTETYRTLWTSWDVNAWKTVPVLVEPVPAGKRVRPDQIQNRRIEATANRSGKPLTREMLLGAKAARDLMPGQVVTELDVHRPPAISVGDSIFLEVRKGPIAARVPAVARQSGAIGDRIRVVRGDSPTAEISALIVSRDLVQIDLAKDRF